MATSNNYPDYSSAMQNSYPDYSASSSNPGTVSTFMGQLPKATPQQIQQSMSFSPEDIKKSAAMALPFVAPEIKAVPVVSNLLSKVPGATAIGNMLGRVGYGTALTTAPDLFSPQGRQNISGDLQKNAGLNSLIEAGTLPFRIPAGFAEAFNPLNYTSQKANQIRTEAQASKAVMNSMYKPVNDAYNDSLVTVTPKKFLNTAGIERSQLFPDAKILHDNFVDDPTFNNLHKLQSKLGNDWARISQHPTTTEKAQLFSQMQDSLQNKAQQFLSRDPNALIQYNAASNYAKNNYFPYVATPTLRNIVNGKTDVAPNALISSLQKGVNKTVGRDNNAVIPINHPLVNHLRDVKNAVNFGKAAQFAVPAAIGAASGEYLHPGLGGMTSGALTGVLAKQLLTKASSGGITDFIQNPLVSNTFKKTAPDYYAGMRAGINYSNQNK